MEQNLSVAQQLQLCINAVGKWYYTWLSKKKDDEENEVHEELIQAKSRDWTTKDTKEKFCL